MFAKVFSLVFAVLCPLAGAFEGGQFDPNDYMDSQLIWEERKSGKQLDLLKAIAKNQTVQFNHLADLVKHHQEAGQQSIANMGENVEMGKEELLQSLEHERYVVGNFTKDFQASSKNATKTLQILLTSLKTLSSAVAKDGKVLTGQTEQFAKLIDHLALRDSALTGKIEAVNGSVFTARVKLLDKLEKKGFESALLHNTSHASLQDSLKEIVGTMESNFLLASDSWSVLASELKDQEAKSSLFELKVLDQLKAMETNLRQLKGEWAEMEQERSNKSTHFHAGTTSTLSFLQSMVSDLATNVRSYLNASRADLKKDIGEQSSDLKNQLTAHNNSFNLFLREFNDFKTDAQLFQIKYETKLDAATSTFVEILNFLNKTQNATLALHKVLDSNLQQYKNYTEFVLHNQTKSFSSHLNDMTKVNTQLSENQKLHFDDKLDRVVNEHFTKLDQHTTDLNSKIEELSETQSSNLDDHSSKLQSKISDLSKKAAVDLNHHSQKWQAITNNLTTTLNHSSHHLSALYNSLTKKLHKKIARHENELNDWVIIYTIAIACVVVVLVIVLVCSCSYLCYKLHAIRNTKTGWHTAGHCLECAEQSQKKRSPTKILSPPGEQEMENLRDRSAVNPVEFTDIELGQTSSFESSLSTEAQSSKRGRDSSETTVLGAAAMRADVSAAEDSPAVLSVSSSSEGERRTRVRTNVQTLAAKFQKK